MDVNWELFRGEPAGDGGVKDGVKEGSMIEVYDKHLREGHNETHLKTAR
jgi:hypothetical protein